LLDRRNILRIGMKNMIRQMLLWLTLVLGVSAIVAVSRLNSFSVRPALGPAPEAISASYFGMTLHHFRATPWPSIPVASLRTWDIGVSWADIQPAPKTYLWSNLDALITLAQRRGVDLVYTLGRTPRWASASPDTKTPYGPGQCAPPANIQYWDEFVRAIVSHAGSKIRFWEIWNEPQEPPFYCGDVSTMVELQRRAYEIIKTIDPAAMVLTPATVGGLGPPWMSRFLAGGGGQYADIMAFHGYLDPGTDAESIIATITKFKAVFAEHGQETKPVWDTEAGWGENSWLSDPDLQAAFLVKFYLLHWSAGVERFYWYGYDNELWGTLWDHKNGLHKAGIAYREVHQWLQGATMTAPCASSRALWKCNLVRKNGYQAIVLWSSAKASASAPRVPVPEEYRQYRDLDGNLQKIVDRSVPISNKPILVETTTAF
jgi:polysaccharide biosynthesis protein PslG